MPLRLTSSRLRIGLTAVIWLVAAGAHCRFIHRTLQEHITTLTNEELATLAQS
ncbi:MAG: hypothetical protein AB1791_06925 [Chloroflexota bacterium]